MYTQSVSSLVGSVAFSCGSVFKQARGTFIYRAIHFGGRGDGILSHNISSHRPLVGPGVLACATPGGGRSEAGHCLHLPEYLFHFYGFFITLNMTPQ